MSEREEPARFGGVGSAAVEAATGRSWDEWLAALDAAGAASKNHQEIVALVIAEGVESGWWQQMLAVGYEQARGLRQKHEKPGGFEVGHSKTMAAPLNELYRAWIEEGKRRAWLGEEVPELRETTPGKSIWLTWSDHSTAVNVRFSEKSEGKSHVSVRHSKLPDGEAADAMKSYWAEKLGALKEYLEE